MKTVSIADIRKWEPCYDPAIFKGENWNGNAIDVFSIPEIPVKDKFWIVLRTDMIDEAVLQSFATWCASQVTHLIPDDKWSNIDMGSVKEAMPEETPERSAISAVHYAKHGMAFEAARDAAMALKDLERTSQINKLLELLNV